MTQMYDLSGRIALVTGASSGLGARFARLLAAHGAKVVVGARRIERLEKLVNEIREGGGEALAVDLDVAEEASVIAAYDAAEARFGTVDTVIACAGSNAEGSVFDVTVEAFDQLMAVNLRGVFQMQLHAQMDVKGAQQISLLLRNFRPLVYGQCLDALSLNRIEYFLGLEDGQIALIPLMSALDTNFAQQMWGYQSRLFYGKDGSPIDEVEALDIQHWHAWIVKNAIEFYDQYGPQILPFSSSRAVLSELPPWTSLASDFESCDRYIYDVWGYAWDSLDNKISQLEFRSILVYIIYSSLAAAIEQ